MSTRNATRLKFEPYPEQHDVLESDARFRVVAAGRRSGKTLMAGFETVRRALASDGDWHGYWVGAEHRHADTGFQLIDNAVPDALTSERKMSPPRTIKFANGARVEFHTAGGGALVSIGLDWVVCDEAGKSFPERSWTQELRPALSDRNGEGMFISTPDGRGWFHDRYQRGQTGDYEDWASWSWATYANPHVDDSEVDDAKDGVPDRIFKQEYLAEFLDESGGVFEDLDERLFTLDSEPADPTPPFAHGWDLARHEDYLVGIVLDADGRLVHFERSQGDAWPQIQTKIEQAAAEYDGIVAIDASRDNKLIADLSEAGLPIEPVKFSPKRKRELVENLITRVENGELGAPEVEQLRHEMEVFEYDVTRGGSIRYDAPEGFHDDTVDALAMAADQLDRVAVMARRDNDGDDDDNGVSYL